MVTKGAVAAQRPNEEVIRDGLHVRQRRVRGVETVSLRGPEKEVRKEIRKIS